MPAENAACNLATPGSQLSREVYGILGIPVHVIDELLVIEEIVSAARSRKRLLMSTPNLNFLVRSQSDVGFRETLLRSDLCIPDGMPVIWLGRIVGAPLKKRLAGSDLLESLKQPRLGQGPLKVFFFGGQPGIGEKACSELRSSGGGLCPVGSYFPGFGDVETMSSDAVVANVNASGADFVIVSLGAVKGQAWLLRNDDRLRIPVRAHLGAAINFQAGTAQRAPKILQATGLEWLWRIKEEPYLWRRYAFDGRKLIGLIALKALPFALLQFICKLTQRQNGLAIAIHHSETGLRVSLQGSAIGPNVEKILPTLEGAMQYNERICVDLSNVNIVDARFMGLLVMLKSKANVAGGSVIIKARPPVTWALKLNGFRYLLG